MRGDGSGLGIVGVLPPGFWSPDLAHFPRPVTRATAAVLVGRFAAESAARWGLLVAGIDFAVDADGWVHVRDESVHDPDEVARRQAAAEATLAGRRWRAEADAWEATTRAAVVAELLALQDESLSALEDAALAGHVVRSVEVARRLLDLHMELHLTDMVPLGFLLAEGEGWGLEPAELIALMRGTSPGSRPSAELLAARASGDAGPFLRLEGHRLISEPEVATPTLHERADLVRQLLSGPLPETPPDDADERIASVRARVPAGDRARFDDLLADARRTYGIRDDNTSLTMMWPLGLVRRAYRAAAARLGGRLDDEADVFEAEPHEVAAMLAGAGAADAPSAAALADRRRHRLGAAAAGPGDGEDDWGPPDPEAMNDAQRRLQDAYDAYGRHFGSGYRRGVRREPLAGIGVGEGRVTGRAVVAVSPLDALDRIGPDTILVVSATAPAYDAVLPLAVGVVVETGGLLCHAALAGRELGIPVVVGVIGATAMIADGEVITVDAAAGRISRASSSPRP